MPQIPQITASGEAATIRYSNVPVPDYGGVAQFGGSIARFGEQLNQIGQKIQHQQDQLDIAQGIGEFHGKMKELQVDVRTDVTDPMQRSKEFNTRASAYLQELTSGARNRMVGAGIQVYASKYLPVYAAHVHADAIQFMGEQQTAQRRDIGEQASRMAMMAETPEIRQEWKDSYIKLINNDPHLTPIAAQKERSEWNSKADTQYMDWLGRTNPDKLEELFNKGAFSAVNPDVAQKIMDASATRNAAKMHTAQVALDKAMGTWREGIEISMVQKITNHSLSENDIKDWEWSFAGTPQGSEKVASWYKALHDIKAGIGTGNPEVERNMKPDITNPLLDPMKTLDVLTTLHTKGLVGTDFYGPAATHLQSEINREKTERRVIQNEGEAKVREIQKTRSAMALQNAALALKNTGFLDLDRASEEALVQFREQFMRREVSHGQGNEDADVLYKELIPQAIQHVDQRMESRVDQLNKQLGSYKDKASLNAARGSMSPTQFETLSSALQELYAIRQNKERLGNINFINGGPKPAAQPRYK